MVAESIKGVLIPFLGTTIGAAGVFFMKRTLNEQLQLALNGFAAGVMVAASIWSLLIPALEGAQAMGRFAFVPATVGFFVGIFALLLLDQSVSRLGVVANSQSNTRKSTVMLVLAVALHNIPEGMAVGVAYAGLLVGSPQITLAGALPLAIGIGIQNFPEGAIVSMPLRAEGMSKWNAFGCGVASGVVEPIAAVLTILLAGLVVPILPYLLSFAAGAMCYVVAVELLPPLCIGKRPNWGMLLVFVGFGVMMGLDIALG